MLTKVLYLLKLSKYKTNNNLTLLFQTNTCTMRFFQTNTYLLLLISILTTSAVAQESIKLTFFKSGVVEYRQTEPFGAKMPDKSLIALMVYVKKNNPLDCKSLGINLSNKIVLIESGDCGLLQTAQAAQEAGASAVIIIDRKGEKLDIKTPMLKIPCLKVDEGTGTFYAQKSEKPVLVCLSGSMYDGKVVSNDPPKVRDIVLDDNTRLALQIPSGSGGGSLSSVRTTEEPTLKPIEVPDLSDTTGVEATGQPSIANVRVPIPSVTPNNNASTSTSPTPDLTPKGVTSASPTAAVASKVEAIPVTLQGNNSQEGNAEFRSQFEVYPRRVSEFLAVTYNLEKRSNLKVVLIDAAGKSILEKNIENALADFIEFEVLKIPSGNYKLMIINDVATASYDIAVQK